MKINIVLGPFLPALPGPAGAVEKIWQGVGERLSQMGHKVTIIEKSGVSREMKQSGLEYLQVRGYDRPKSILRALVLDFCYSHQVLRALPTADITVTNTFFLPTKFMQLQRHLLSHKIGILIPNVARMPKGQMRFFGNIEAITTVSEASRKAIASEFGAEKLEEIVHVIPNPVDTTVFHERVRHLNSIRRILYAGRISPEKGVLELVSAFAALRRKGRLKAFELVLVGPYETRLGGGGEAYLKACKGKASGQPVYFLEPIQDPNLLADEMRKAEFFAYPSLAEKGETFGVSVLEAMACGTVPIVSDLACFKDFVTHRENGLILDHRGNPEKAIENALLEISQIDDTTALSSRAVTTARYYSYETVTAQYEQLFSELVQRRMRRA